MLIFIKRKEKESFIKFLIMLINIRKYVFSIII